MRVRPLLPVFSILATLSGCNASPAGDGQGVPATFVLSPSTVWAGGSVQVRSSAFRTPGSGGVIQIGDSTVTLIRLDDSTMTARVPSTFNGATTPTVRLTGASAGIVANVITGYGFVESTSYAQQLAEDVYVWPRGGHARIMGMAAPGGGSVEGLTLIDLDDKATTNLPTIAKWDAIHGPGATYQDSVFVLKRSFDGPVETWRILPTPILLESHPEVVTSRQAMQLGQNSWFTSSNHTFAFPGFSPPNGAAEETEGVFISPRLDRATITVDHVAGLPGIPVLAMPSGQLAYSVTGLQSAQGVDFSADGSQLIMVGGANGQPEGNAHIQLLNASSGIVLHDTTLSVNAFAIALDPVRPLVYVGVSSAGSYAVSNPPMILVLDRATFKVVGELHIPASAPACFLSCYKGVIAVSNAPALYLFWGYNGASRAYKFSVPPQ